MNYVNLLIKPASGLCNMRCRYCFYQDETAKRADGNTGIMTPETTEILVKSTFQAHPKHGITFAFQGGEPTMAGLSYFKLFVSLVNQYNTNHIPVQYAIQTNGLALNNEWVDFFKLNHFLVGISTDGTQYLHDQLRLDAAGNPTWERITQNLKILQEKQVDVNFLCVVSRWCAKNPQKVYRALKELGAQYIQFIPCLDPLDSPRGAMPYSLTPELYGKFLCGVFDLWYKDWRSGEYTSVRLFDDYVHLAMGLPSGTCATSGSCGAYLVVEGDGSLYPCDFFCLDEWKLGNLGERTIEDVMASPLAQRFLAEGHCHPKECADCPWYRICSGGCKRDWYQDSCQNSHNYFCPAFRRFFSYAASRISEVAREEVRARTNYFMR